MKIRLKCRVCDDEAEFASTEKAVASDWTEPAALGAVHDGYSEHRAYCPGHSLDR